MADASDFKLPDSIVSRILKRSMPESGNVSKLARTAISHAAAIFVLYTTTQACQVSSKHRRKLVTGDDVLQAMKDMDFSEFVPDLEDTLEQYRQSQAAKIRSKEVKADEDSVPIEHEFEDHDEDDDEMPVDTEGDSEAVLDTEEGIEPSI
ncbi:unnamed protein product [Notodromas monacha]|uniref:DNA polymerase epsilon subunit 3 n=1 Tax=Notodromas monacha TaxID=399045 RepID=A0A7R9BF42_9CRUS|nr:unnamed protein product [Notodromas monacha]CAG0913663.1 unnamed protein product [Notodromas monacha]